MNEISQYFENIARQYLGHTDTEKHYFPIGLDEFLSGLQTKVHYPALLLDRNEIQYRDNGADNYTKQKTIGFVLIDNVASTDDYTAQEKAYTDMEKLLDKIVGQMHSDKYTPQTTIIADFDINSIDVSPIANYADGNYGYYCTMTIETQYIKP